MIRPRSPTPHNCYTSPLPLTVSLLIHPSTLPKIGEHYSWILVALFLGELPLNLKDLTHAFFAVG